MRGAPLAEPVSCPLSGLPRALASLEVVDMNSLGVFVFRSPSAFLNTASSTGTTAGGTNNVGLGLNPDFTVDIGGA